jgi:hypothetical protein
MLPVGGSETVADLADRLNIRGFFTAFRCSIDLFRTTPLNAADSMSTIVSSGGIELLVFQSRNVADTALQPAMSGRCRYFLEECEQLPCDGFAQYSKVNQHRMVFLLVGPRLAQSIELFVPASLPMIRLKQWLYELRFGQSIESGQQIALFTVGNPFAIDADDMISVESAFRTEATGGFTITFGVIPASANLADVFALQGRISLGDFASGTDFWVIVSREAQYSVIFDEAVALGIATQEDRQDANILCHQNDSSFFTAKFEDVINPTFRIYQFHIPRVPSE